MSFDPGRLPALEPGERVVFDMNMNIPGRGVMQTSCHAKVIGVIDGYAVSIEFEQEGQIVQRVVPRGLVHRKD